MSRPEFEAWFGNRALLAEYSKMQMKKVCVFSRGNIG